LLNNKDEYKNKISLKMKTHYKKLKNENQEKKDFILIPLLIFLNNIQH
jgi:hypothetical protein